MYILKPITTWPEIKCSFSKCIKLFVVADPQILGKINENVLTRYDSDRFVKMLFERMVQFWAIKISLFLQVSSKYFFHCFRTCQAWWHPFPGWPDWWRIFCWRWAICSILRTDQVHISAEKNDKFQHTCNFLFFFKIWVKLRFINSIFSF